MKNKFGIFLLVVVVAALVSRTGKGEPAILQDEESLTFLGTVSQMTVTTNGNGEPFAYIWIFLPSGMTEEQRLFLRPMVSSNLWIGSENEKSREAVCFDLKDSANYPQRGQKVWVTAWRVDDLYLFPIRSLRNEFWLGINRKAS